MSKTFTVMKDEVANMCLDTSTDFKNLIAVWINDAYKDANLRFYWMDMIETNYTFESTSNKITLPTDFLRELNLTNIATGKELEGWDIRKWWKERGTSFNNDALSPGTPEKYIILLEEGKLQLDPSPLKTETYQLLYQKSVTSLSADSDTCEITNLDAYLIKYAIGQGFAYYKQYEKADWWTSKAEMELLKISGFYNATLEQTYKRYPGRNKKLYWLRRLVGGESYDSI